MNSRILETLMFLCSVHLGRFSDHYDFLISICITLQNSKSVQNDLVFKTVRFIFDLTIFFVAESLLFWRLQTSYSRVYNPKEICYKKHITVLTDDFAWIPSIESTSKSLSSECLMCHVFRIIRRGNWSNLQFTASWSEAQVTSRTFDCREQCWGLGWGWE